MTSSEVPSVIPRHDAHSLQGSASPVRLVQLSDEAKRCWCVLVGDRSYESGEGFIIGQAQGPRNTL